MSNDNKQYIAITVDFCDGLLTTRSNRNYDLVYDGCRKINNEIRSTFAEEDIVFTFFVRADDQIKYLFNTVSYFFDRYRNFWLEATDAGDEIGWHPHLYRFRGSMWMPQTDGAGVERQLRSCYSELPMDTFFINSTRVGEGMMTNHSINILDKLGLRVDSTALPGRTRKDSERVFDWSKAPITPYHPSRFDYSTIGMPGGNLNLLEIPFTMVEMKAPYDSAPLKRYLDLTFDPEVVQPKLIDALKKSQYTVAVIHPSFMLGISHKHELIKPGIETVVTNIRQLLEAVEKLGKTPVFLNIKDMYTQVTGYSST